VTKNAKTISITAIAGVIAVIVILLARDIFLRRQLEFECGDGPRRTIDIRDFTTQYSGYSIQLEAAVMDKAKISTKVTPVQLQQLSEALQNAQEFRKFVVAGYNSCAITKTEYGNYGAKFQALDAVAREINQLAISPSLSTEQSKNLTSLIGQFADLARKASVGSGQQPMNQVQQRSTGPGSPNVQGVQGDVTITVDQNGSEAKPKKPAEKKPDQKN
jgi:hypothetical protein